MKKKKILQQIFTCLLIEIHKMSVCTALTHYGIQI